MEARLAPSPDNHILFKVPGGSSFADFAKVG
jgi:hypothetical protein